MASWNFEASPPKMSCIFRGNQWDEKLIHLRGILGATWNTFSSSISMGEQVGLLPRA